MKTVITFDIMKEVTMRMFFSLVILSLSLGLSLSAYAQNGFIHGRIIDERMEDLLGAQITNLKTNQKLVSDIHGLYAIQGSVGDTIIYQFVGVTMEKRVIKDVDKHIDVVLMNKSVNDLGAIWTKRMWRKADRQMASAYKKLEAKAKRLGKWNY